MATREDLLKALMKADENGDDEAASLFADQIKALDDAPKRDVQAEYNAMGMGDQAMTALADVTRLASGGATFGYRDKMAAGLKSLFGDKSYDENLAAERQATEDARVRAGSAATAAEITGGLATGSAAARGGLSMMNYVDASKLPFLGRLAAAGGAGAVEGSIAGGLQASGEDRSIPQGITEGGIVGGLAGPAAETLSTLFNKITGRGLGNPAAAPTVDELDARVAQGYDDLEKAGVRISPDAVADLNDQMRRNVQEGPSGVRSQRHPAALAEIEALREYSPSVQDPVRRASRVTSASDGTSTVTKSVNNNPPRTTDTQRVARGDVEKSSTTFNMNPDQGLSLYDLEQHRQAVMQNVGRHADPAERHHGGNIIEQIDKFAKGLGPGDVTVQRGNVKDAVENLQDTRKAAHTNLKLKETGKAVRSAERQIEGTDSQSPTNVIRGKIRNMLDNDKKIMGYTPDEIADMEAINKGTRFGNAMRTTARLAGSVPGYGALGGAGALAGGVVGGPGGAGVGSTVGLLSAAGLKAGANRLAEKSTEKQVDALLDTIARGGTKKSARVKPKFVTPGELSRFLTLLGIDQEEDD